MGPRKIDKGPKILFEEKIAENFPNLGKQTDIHVCIEQSPKKDQPKQDHMEMHLINW